MRQFTPEEIDALPRGPFVQHSRPVTREDIESGRVKGGHTIVWHEHKQVELVPFESDDPLYHVDTKGRRWSIGKWVDGGFYKEPSIFDMVG